jgi:hypothetical protein
LFSSGELVHENEGRNGKTTRAEGKGRHAGHRKHDPNELSSTHPKPRTVVAAELAPKLPEFFASLDFEITHYENTSHPKTPDY